MLHIFLQMFFKKDWHGLRTREWYLAKSNAELTAHSDRVRRRRASDESLRIRYYSGLSPKSQNNLESTISQLVCNIIFGVTYSKISCILFLKCNYFCGGVGDQSVQMLFQALV